MNRTVLPGMAILLLFHVSGFIGMQTSAKGWFIDATPLNLLICLAVVIFQQPEKNTRYYLAVLLTGLAGFMTEVAGVNTGMIFGTYRYGAVLGPKFWGTPILISVNWILVMEMGIAVAALRPGISRVWRILVAGTIPVLLDILIEPAAIRMGWWAWENGAPPIQNYLGWWVTGTCFAALRFLTHSAVPGLTALVLLGIQAVFFLLLLLFPVFA